MRADPVGRERLGGGGGLSMLVLRFCCGVVIKANYLPLIYAHDELKMPFSLIRAICGFGEGLPVARKKRFL